MADQDDDKIGGHETFISPVCNTNNDNEMPFLEEGTPLRGRHNAYPLSDDAIDNGVQ